MKGYIGTACLIEVTPLVVGWVIEVDSYFEVTKSYIWAVSLEQVFDVLDKHGVKLI